jgi:hypothetical protein
MAMRAVTSVPGVAVVLALLIVTALSGCKSDSSPGSAAAPASTASQAPPPTAASPATAASSASTASASASASGIQNLTVDADVRAELLSAYAVLMRIPAADATARLGETYYAYDPTSHTYWAQADYGPTSGDPAQVTYEFQDGGQIGYFKKVGSGSWQVENGGEPAICEALKFFPVTVLAAWSQATTAPAGVCS